VRHKARYWATTAQRGNVYSLFGDLLAILGLLHDFTWLAADKFPASMYDFPGSPFPISTLSAALPCSNVSNISSWLVLSSTFNANVHRYDVIACNYFVLVW